MYSLTWRMLLYSTSFTFFLAPLFLSHPQTLPTCPRNISYGSKYDSSTKFNPSSKLASDDKKIYINAGKLVRENDTQMILKGFPCNIVKWGQPGNRLLWPTAAKCKGKPTWETRDNKGREPWLSPTSSSWLVEHKKWMFVSPTLTFPLEELSYPTVSPTTRPATP